jgi:hypothetical protein
MKDRATLVKTNRHQSNLCGACWKGGFGAPPEVQAVGVISIDIYDVIASSEDPKECYPTMAVIISV